MPFPDQPRTTDACSTGSKLEQKTIPEHHSAHEHSWASDPACQRARLPHEFCRDIVLVCNCFGFIIVAAFLRHLCTRTADGSPPSEPTLRGLARSAPLDDQLVLSMQHTILTSLYRNKFVDSEFWEVNRVGKKSPFVVVENNDPAILDHRPRSHGICQHIRAAMTAINIYEIETAPLGGEPGQSLR